MSARDAGITRPRLRRLLEGGAIERVAHGLYATDAEPLDLDLVEAASASSMATVCLVSALAHHDLVDEIPSTLHVAGPHNHHTPRTSRSLRWHRFAVATFDIGRDTMSVGGGLSLGVCSAERSIVDGYRLRHIHGVEQAREALRSWLATGAADVYRRAKRGRRSHPHAARILGRAWIRVMWRCWIDRHPYDPALHGNARLLATA